jgi:CRISPR/Cas system-associated exonuclease Cas4 (RecB family)
MFLKTSEELKKELQERKFEERGNQLVNDFISMLDTWFSLPIKTDSNLEAYYFQAKAEIALSPTDTDFKKKYFTPSSANSCPRELYCKLKGMKRDTTENLPYRGRWQRMGTLFGEMVQKELLYIHKHYKQATGENPPFVPHYVELQLGEEVKKYPAWEDFVKRSKTIVWNGVEVNLMGMPDGILKYKDGSTVGLEIKSKQTSYSRTSHYSMKSPSESHVLQLVGYSLLYGIDEFIILYGNLSKKDWLMSHEEYDKYPDIRAFYVRVTEEDREQLLDRFSAIVKAVKEGNPPKLDIDKWVFNNYKHACIISLTDDEVEEIRDMYEETMFGLSKSSKVSRGLKTKLETLRDILKHIDEVKGGGLPWES